MKVAWIVLMAMPPLACAADPAAEPAPVDLSLKRAATELLLLSGAVRTFRHGRLRARGYARNRSGFDVPLLAGVVELGPLADHRPVSGFAVLRVQHHAVGDVADRVVAARRGDVPFLAEVAERRPQVDAGAVEDPAVHGVEDGAAADVGDG